MSRAKSLRRIGCKGRVITFLVTIDEAFGTFEAIERQRLMSRCLREGLGFTKSEILEVEHQKEQLRIDDKMHS